MTHARTTVIIEFGACFEAEVKREEGEHQWEMKWFLTCRLCVTMMKPTKILERRSADRKN